MISVYDTFSRAPAQLGAVDLSITQSPDGVPLLSADASNALALLLSARYPVQTGSGRIVNGQAVAEPALDPTADYQTLVASQTNPGGATAASTVLDQVNGLPAGYVALFDVNAVQQNLSGTPTDIPYAIAKPSAAKVLGPSAQLAAMQGGTMGAGGGAGGAAKSGLSMLVLPLVGAGIGLLVAGPVGALVGGGAGAVVEYLREQKKAA